MCSGTIINESALPASGHGAAKCNALRACKLLAKLQEGTTAGPGRPGRGSREEVIFNQTVKNAHTEKGGDFQAQGTEWAEAPGAHRGQRMLSVAGVAGTGERARGKRG